MAKKKKESVQEEVQQIDLTELVNYVNYLGQKVEEIGQTAQSSVLRFGMEQVESEGQLRGIKYFHIPVVSEMCGDITTNMKEFYSKKYGMIPQIIPPDFYAF